jgi:hypothetical protein
MERMAIARLATVDEVIALCEHRKDLLATQPRLVAALEALKAKRAEISTAQRALQANSRISDVVRDCGVIMRLQLDPAVSLLKFAHYDFYKQYQQRRATKTPPQWLKRRVVEL